jgi:hypothetical protein
MTQRNRSPTSPRFTDIYRGVTPSSSNTTAEEEVSIKKVDTSKKKSCRTGLKRKLSNGDAEENQKKKQVTKPRKSEPTAQVVNLLLLLLRWRFTFYSTGAKPSVESRDNQF